MTVQHVPSDLSDDSDDEGVAYVTYVPVRGGGGRGQSRGRGRGRPRIHPQRESLTEEAYLYLNTKKLRKKSLSKLFG